LHIAWIVMVEDVEDGSAGAQVQVLLANVRREWSCDLEVSRFEAGKPFRTARPYVVSILVLDGVRKPGVHVINGQDG